MAIISVGQISIVDVNDGLSAQLSANSVLLPADSSGNVTSYAGAETSFSILEAGQDTSATWSYAVTALTGNLAYRDINDTSDRVGVGTDPYYFVSGRNVKPTQMPGQNRASNATEAGYGPVYDLTSTNGALNDHVVYTPINGGVPALKLKVEVEYRVLSVTGTATAGSNNIQIQMGKLLGDYTGGSYPDTKLRVLTEADIGMTYTDTTLFAATATAGYITMDITSSYFRPYVRLVSATGQTITIRVMRITTTDISDANNQFKAAPDRYRNNGLGSLDSNYLRIVGAPKSNGYIDITATKPGMQPMVRRFSVAKAATGQTGQTGTRGTVTVSRAISGASWSDTEANAAVSGIGAGSPLKGDTVTLYRISPPYSETRIYSGTAWITQAAYLAGSQIIDNSLPGTKITAASISATQLQAGSILASKLIVADTSNIAKNPNFGYNGVPDLDGWNGLAGSALAMYASDATVPTGAPTSTLLRLANSTFVQDVAVPYVEVVPGETYFMEVWIATSSDVNLGGGAGLGVTLQDRNGNNASYPGVTTAPGYSTTIGSPTTAWTRLAGTITIPAGVGRLIPRLTVRGQATSPVGYVYFTKFGFRKVNNGEMIVDGTITANKLVTNIITTNYLATDSVTARNVLANSISVEKLLVGDQNDYILNPSFDPSGPPITPVASGGNAISLIASSAAEVPAGAPTPYVVKLAGRDHRPFPNMSRIPVRAGDKLFVSAMVAMPANSTARFNLYMYRSSTETGGSVSAVGVASGQNATTTWTRVSGVYTCQAADEGKYMEPFLQLEQASPFGSVAYVTDWHCKRQNTGELIVDGTIKTNHFTANSINGSIMTANSINANKLNVATRPLSTAGLNFRIDATGILRWDAGKVYYPNDNGTIIERTVASGTAAWNGVAKYAHLYVAEGATNTNLDIFDDTRLVGNGNYRHLLTWEGGSKLTVFSGISTSINGGDIVTGTIRAAQIATRTLVAENVVLGTLTGNEIASDTITTNHLKAGSITTQLLAAGAITTTKLGIGNNDNIIPDADYRDPDFWGITNDSRFELFDTSAAWTYARRALRFKASGSIGDRPTVLFPVEPGSTYKVKVSTYVGTNFNYADGWLNTAILLPSYMYYNLKTGQAFPNSDPTVRNSDSWTTTTGSGTVDVKELTLTIPASSNLRQIQLRYFGNVLGDIIEQAVSITRVSDATLIANGAIQTRHITVNTLDGDVIQAGTMNANKLKADSVLAGTITVSGSSDTLSTVVGRAADPAARINNGPTTQVDPGRISISGGLSLNDWRDGTEILGGKLKTGSVLASALTINSRGISTENIDFEVQTINGGQELVWTSGGYVQYIASDTKAAKSVQIVHAGTTGTNPRSTFGVSKRCFVYWIEGETIFRVGTSAETILNNPNAVIIGTYMGGTNFNVYYGGTVINGSRITTGSISADRITAGSILSSTITVGSATGPTIASLGTTAVWSSVSGTGKPADNATVGAPAGTSINGVAVETITGAIAAITDDNIISPAEKTALLNQYNDVLQNENKTWLRISDYVNAGKGGRYDAQTKRDQMSAAKDAVGTALGSTFNDMSSPTSVNGAGIRNAFTNFYDKFAVAQVALQQLAAETGDWTQIGGTGKPADNATVGAPTGTTVGGIEAGTVATSATNSGNLTYSESTANAGYSVFGNLVQRTVTKNGFYGNMYSQEFGRGSARISARMMDKDVFFGLDDDRAANTDSAYIGLSAAWHWSGGSNNWQIWEGGNSVWSGTGFDQYTTFSIEYDGLAVKYYANTTLIRTVATSSNRTFFAGVCIGGLNGRVGNITFQTINDNSLVNTDPAAAINRNTTTINGGKITTGTIDAGKINVDTLAAIKANLGAITAGSLTSQSGKTVLDLNNNLYNFEASEFRIRSVSGGQTTTPFELVNGVLNLRNIAVDGGTLKNVSISTDKLQGNSVTTNAYMVIDYGGSINNIAANVWADFDTAQYNGGGGGGGGGSGGGGGGTPNVNLQ